MRGLVNASTGIPYTNDVIYPTNQDQTIPKNSLLVNGLTIKSCFSKLPTGTYQCQSGVWQSKSPLGDGLVKITGIKVGGMPTNVGIEFFSIPRIRTSGRYAMTSETIIRSQSEVDIKISDGLRNQQINELHWFIARKIK